VAIQESTPLPLAVVAEESLHAGTVPLAKSCRERVALALHLHGDWILRLLHPYLVSVASAMDLDRKSCLVNEFRETCTAAALYRRGRCTGNDLPNSFPTGSARGA
jgi:hypothetical protein